MFRSVKYIMLIALILFVFSCTKNNEKTHDHKDPHNHKVGELCIDPVAGKVAEYSLDGKYQDAIDVLVAAKDVPGYQWNRDKIYESMIYLYDKTKQYKMNLDVWRDGHSKGMVFKMDKTQKHFKPYLELEGFEEIYEKDLKLQKELEKTE